MSTKFVVALAMVVILWLMFIALMNKRRYNEFMRIKDVFATAAKQMMHEDFESFISKDIIWLCKKTGPKSYKMYAIEDGLVSRIEEGVAGYILVCKTVEGHIAEWYI